jgi:trehalose 6-phosphate synthase/phosphatase
LVTLLEALCAEPRFDVHLVSGRTRATLTRWFGHLDASLWAEHSFWHRDRGHRGWRAMMAMPHGWRSQVAPFLEDAARRTPGAWVERKSASLAWHYRLAPPALGARRARALTRELGSVLEGLGLEPLLGRKVVEVRPAGSSKAAVAHWLRERGVTGDAVVAVGDDRTDGELFAALPPGAVTVAVGPSAPGARHVVRGPRDVRRLLQALIRRARKVRAAR